MKVEATVVRPVAIAGFGTYFELEKSPVTAEIWLPAHFSIRSRARGLSLFTRPSQVDETYIGYHAFGPSVEEP